MTEQQFAFPLGRIPEVEPTSPPHLRLVEEETSDSPDQHQLPFENKLPFEERRLIENAVHFLPKEFSLAEAGAPKLLLHNLGREDDWVALAGLEVLPEWARERMVKRLRDTKHGAGGYPDIAQAVA